MSKRKATSSKTSKNTLRAKKKQEREDSKMAAKLHRELNKELKKSQSVDVDLTTATAHQAEEKYPRKKEKKIAPKSRIINKRKFLQKAEDAKTVALLSQKREPASTDGTEFFLLDVIPISSDQKDKHKGDNQCPICLEYFKHGDLIRTLRCVHKFHKTCIAQWININPSCPLCKSEI
jgi:hypothetical protein